MKRKQNMVTLILGIIAGVVAIVVAFVQYVEKNNQEKETEKYRAKFDNAQAKTIRLLEEQTDSLLEIKALNENINSLQAELIKTQGELLKFETGDDGYPILALKCQKTKLPHPNSATESYGEYVTIEFDIMNCSDYPFKGLTISVNDIWTNILGPTLYIDYKEPRADKKDIEIAVLKSNSIRGNIYTMTIPNPDNGEQIAIRIHWNGGVIEYYMNVFISKDNSKALFKYDNVLLNEIEKQDIKALKGELLNCHSEYSYYIQ